MQFYTSVSPNLGGIMIQILSTPKENLKVCLFSGMARSDIFTIVF